MTIEYFWLEAIWILALIFALLALTTLKLR